MKIRVRLFAAAKQLAGAEAIDVEVPEPPTVAALRAAMEARIPALSPLLRHAMFAVDAEYVSQNTVLTADSDVACIPPVSGG